MDRRKRPVMSGVHRVEQRARLQPADFAQDDAIRPVPQRRFQQIVEGDTTSFREPAPKKSVYVLTTGGTIEKVYSENTGSISNVENKIDRYLRLLRLPDWDVNVVPLMNKDSLEMTD
jgi:L-asparaginase/Glu-tRNA(Gln) amidotransferase subunit D